MLANLDSQQTSKARQLESRRAQRRNRSQRRLRRVLSMTIEPLEPRTLLSGAGPKIIAIAPTDVSNAVFDHVDVTFDTAIDPATLTTADVTFKGPNGAITPSGVVASILMIFGISFNALTARGTYRMAIGPNIADTGGRLMDQNQNGTAGEVPGDVFTSSLAYIQAGTIFTTLTTIGETNTIYDGQNIAIDGTTVTIDGTHNFQSVQLVHGAVLTHSASTTTATHKLDLNVVDQIIVDATSKIDVTAKGYLAGRTIGNSTIGGATGWTGGTYGGLGGVAQSTTNLPYGDYTGPADLGSGGADSSRGGAGGGSVRLTAQVVQLDGAILANGGPVKEGELAGGGGSGGSIRLDVTAALTGSGLIQANGGDGRGQFGTNTGGGGGGGRIAIHAQTLEVSVTTGSWRRAGVAEVRHPRMAAPAPSTCAIPTSRPVL